MSIRLSGAQVQRIEEALERYNRFRYYGRQLITEELVEDILKEVLPECPLAANKNELQNANVS